MLRRRRRCEKCFTNFIRSSTTTMLIIALRSVVQGVVIGYDHRALGTLSSKSFARISAAVFLSAGYKVLSTQLPMFTAQVSNSLLL
jgi:phosphomannomutase